MYLFRYIDIYVPFDLSYKTWFQYHYYYNKNSAYELFPLLVQEVKLKTQVSLYEMSNVDFVNKSL